MTSTPGPELPSVEYLVSFRDGSVTLLVVHPDQSLESELAEMLEAAGTEGGDVRSVEFARTYLLSESAV